MPLFYTPVRPHANRPGPCNLQTSELILRGDAILALVDGRAANLTSNW
jgi:hypothetical protein